MPCTTKNYKYSILRQYILNIKTINKKRKFYFMHSPPPPSPKKGFWILQLRTKTCNNLFHFKHDFEKRSYMPMHFPELKSRLFHFLPLVFGEISKFFLQSIRQLSQIEISVFILIYSCKINKIILNLMIVLMMLIYHV